MAKMEEQEEASVAETKDRRNASIVLREPRPHDLGPLDLGVLGPPDWRMESLSGQHEGNLKQTLEVLG